MTYKQFLIKACTRVRDLLLLQSWDISLELVSNKKMEDKQVAAWIVTDFRYSTAHITFTRLAKKAWETDIKELWHVIIHEHCHILTDRMYELALVGSPVRGEDKHIEQIREQWTEHISKVVIQNLSPSFYNLEG